MSSFFGKLRSNQVNPGQNNGMSASKKDALAAYSTPLERLLEGSALLREDASDKYFGMENFGNTCYCNSILQCLYHSLPFREHVVLQPASSRPPSTRSASNGPAQPQSRAPNSVNGIHPALFGTSTANSPARKALLGSQNSGVPGMRPEDRPDSPEYKKKMAMMAGPILSLELDDPEAHGASGSLFTSLKTIFHAISAHPSRIGVVSPLQFLEALKRQNEMFRSPMHQDAHEFLNLLLNEVMAGVEASSKQQQQQQQQQEQPQELVNAEAGTESPLSSRTMEARDAAAQLPLGQRWVQQLFEGTLTSETKCLTCETTSARDEPFLDLSVDLEEHSSVTSCLRKFSEEEMLCERNKFHCDHCGGLQEAERRMKIKRLPRILALHLKRFKYSEDLQRMHKLFHRVVYPYHLRLFNTTDDAEDPDRLYELYAIVVHIGGGPYHGHYVSVVKTPECGWLLFDDELVEPVDKSYVRNFFGDRPGLAAAYVLFYQETTYEAVRREQEAEAAAAAAAALKTNKATSSSTTTTMGPKRSVDGLTTSSAKPASGLPPSLLTSALPNEKQQPATTANGDTLPSKSPVSANGRENGVLETSPVAETANGKMPPLPPPPPPPQPSAAQPAERTRSSARASFGHLRRKVLNSFSSSKDNAKNGHTDS